MEEILKRIRETRKQKGFTLENMANDLNISESAYRKIENNQTTLSLYKFLRIAKMLDVSIADLVGEKSCREYHPHNTDKGTFIGHPEFENYYQENKEITCKLINSMESNIKHLQEEILFLRNQLSDKQLVVP
jgi:transcriptional regulator with XRE-family HTH domain